MGRSEPILHLSVIVGCRDRRPGDSKRLKSHGGDLNGLGGFTVGLPLVAQ